MGGVKASGVGGTCGLLLCFQMAWAAPEIYTCEANGKRITRDRYIEECSQVDQQVRNSDGSVKRVIPAKRTAEQAASDEALERAKAEAAAIAREAVKSDRNLLVRFPNEAKHQLARVAALDGPNKSIKLAEGRLVTLAAERKVLDDEAEFYKGRQMPAKLKALFDANDASTSAQQSSLQRDRSEVARINGNFDAELFRLKQLWSGVQPGSTRPPSGTATMAEAASAPVAATARKTSSK